MLKDNNVYKNSHPIDKLDAFIEFMKELDETEKQK